MTKSILLFKIDTSGMTPEEATVYSEKVKKDLLDSFSPIEKASCILLFMPAFVGDIGDVKMVGTIEA